MHNNFRLIPSRSFAPSWFIPILCRIPVFVLVKCSLNEKWLGICSLSKTRYFLIQFLCIIPSQSSYFTLTLVFFNFLITETLISLLSALFWKNQSIFQIWQALKAVLLQLFEHVHRKVLSEHAVIQHSIGNVVIEVLFVHLVRQVLFEHIVRLALL